MKGPIIRVLRVCSGSFRRPSLPTGLRYGSSVSSLSGSTTIDEDKASLAFQGRGESVSRIRHFSPLAAALPHQTNSLAAVKALVSLCLPRSRRNTCLEGGQQRGLPRGQHVNTADSTGTFVETCVQLSIPRALSPTYRNSN